MESDDNTLREILREIRDLRKEVQDMAASVEEVTAALTTLTTDLEGLAATATAEFEKLEKEVAEGKPAELEPLKTAVEALDTRVKAAVVPTA